MNIILITIDGLRPDFTGYLGGKRITPNIDRVAEESVLFEKAYSTGPKTPFSFPAIVYSRFRNMQKTDHIPRRVPTVAEVFQREGFHTIAIQAGNPYLSRYFNYDKGFDEFLDYIFPSHVSEAEKNKIALRDFWKSSTPHILKRFQRYLLNRTPHIECEKIVADAGKYISYYMGKDLFIWLHFMDTHPPFVPKKQLLKSKNEYNYSFFSHLSDLYRHSKLYSVSRDARRYRFDAKSLDSLKQFYSCCVQYVDMAVGHLISFLRKYGIYDDSILILTSDHGECFGDHGKIGHPPNELCNALIHVPLIVKDVNQESVKRIRKPVSHIDLFPSIMERIGIKYPSEFCGKNVLFHSTDKPIFSCGIDAKGQVISCIYKKWKYIWYEVYHKEKLYNLEEDPSEEFDQLLNCTNKDTVKKMERFLKEFILWASNKKNEIYPERLNVKMKIKNLEKEEGI